MPEFDMGSALVGVGINIDVFDEFFREYFFQRGGEVPVEVHPPDNPDAVLASIVLREPHYSLDTLSAQLTCHLIMDGTFSSALLGEGATEVRLNIGLDLGLRDGAVGELGFRYAGVAIEQMDDNLGDVRGLIETNIDSMFGTPTEGSIVATILNLSLPLGGPLIDAVRGQLFPDGDAPGPAEWPLIAEYLAPATLSEEDCIALFIARPGDDARPAFSRSFVPDVHGLAILYAQRFLDPLFERGASARVGQCKEGVRLDRFSLAMAGDAIQVEGQVSDGPVEIPFAGPGHPYLYRGTTLMGVNTDDIHADIPEHLIRFLRALSILIAPIALLGLIAIGVGFAIHAAWSASNKLADAQNKIQDSLAGPLSAALSILANNLQHNEAFEAGDIVVTMEATPNGMNAIEGNMLFFAHTFILQEEVEMVDGWYSKKVRRFVLFLVERENGQRYKFRASELARLVAAGKLVVPGFHAVTMNNGVSYMRANPNDENADNLFRRFRDNAPDEPIAEEDFPEEFNSQEDQSHPADDEWGPCD